MLIIPLFVLSNDNFDFLSFLWYNMPQLRGENGL